MTELGLAVLVFALLCAGAVLGRFIRLRLPEAHRTRETIETMQMIVGMLVTFAAVVLGLLTASVKTSFDAAAHDRQVFALQLTELDQCLRNYGSETATARDMLRSYTAGVIAMTWPNEPRPPGTAYPAPMLPPSAGTAPALVQLINGVGLQLRYLTPANTVQRGLRDDCLGVFKTVQDARLSVIEDLRTAISTPFYSILVIWLLIVFAAVGLIAPRNSLTMLIIGLCAFSLSSAVFVINDLSHPYSGVFDVGSEDMRTALAGMMRQGP